MEINEGGGGGGEGGKGKGKTEKIFFPLCLGSGDSIVVMIEVPIKALVQKEEKKKKRLSRKAPVTELTLVISLTLTYRQTYVELPIHRSRCEPHKLKHNWWNI